MQQKKLTSITIILCIAIFAVIIIAMFQTKFFSEASNINFTNILANLTINPPSGNPGTIITVNISNALQYPANSPIDIRMDKYDGPLLTTFTSTSETDSYTSNVIIPENTTPGKHQIVVYGNIYKNGAYRIWGFADLEILVSLPQPTASESSISPSVTSSETSITTFTTSTPIIASTTTTTATTPTPIPTITLPTIIAPSTSVPIVQNTSEPLYSIPPVIVPTTTISITPIPDITAVPIIVTDDKTGSTIETDKNQISADGQDKVVIGVTLKNDNNKPINETPTIQVTGNDNTLSEIKNEGEGKYTVSLSTTNPEEKTILVKTSTLELPEVKIAAKSTNLNLEKLANARLGNYTRWYESWWSWTLLVLLICLIFTLISSYKLKTNQSYSH